MYFQKVTLIVFFQKDNDAEVKMRSGKSKYKAQNQKVFIVYFKALFMILQANVCVNTYTQVESALICQKIQEKKFKLNNLPFGHNNHLNGFHISLVPFRFDWQKPDFP